MKKKILSIALSAAMGLITLCSCAPTASVNANNAQTTQTPAYVTITSSTDGKTLSMLSGEILEFASNYAINVENPYSATFCNGTTKYNPTPIRLEWQDKKAATHYTVKLSLNTDMSAAKSYTVFQNYVDVEDLFMGTKYYYRVYAHRADNVSKSQVFSFTTAHLPRTLRFDTTRLDANTRDIGGYYTEDGKYRVKQGMAIRGAEVKDYTQESKNKLLYEHNIKTELAVHGEETSLLSDSINYIYTESPHYVNYGGIQYVETWLGTAENPVLVTTAANLAKALKVFADADNYPIFFHCQLGRDRTGTLAFLLGALLGVGKQDLFLDYELSYLSQYGGYSWQTNGGPKAKVGQFERMYNFIDTGKSLYDEKHDDYGNPISQSEISHNYINASDTTLAQKTATWLKGQLGAYGIDDTVIAQIRANLLEEV